MALLVLAGCAVADAGDVGADRTPRAAGSLTVLAAASLTDVFQKIAAAFEDEHPGIDVVLAFGGSSALAQQVLAGAPADLLATASPETMSLVAADGSLAGEPTAFATNHLEIAVPKGNPGGVLRLADFADPHGTFALCAPEVPCGAAAERVFAEAGVVPRPDTLERDSRAALAKVRLGEVDAALVYRTDVLSAPAEVDGVALAASPAASTSYQLAVVDRARDPQAATDFADFVLGGEAREILRDAGFVVP